LEDILAIELMLAHDLLSVAPNKPVLGAGTSAAQRLVEEAIAVADSYPDSVHQALRDRFPAPEPGLAEPVRSGDGSEPSQCGTMNAKVARTA
jgi:histidine ammonia-lyase